mgnify:CR=1 FL=1
MFLGTGAWGIIAGTLLVKPQVVDLPVILIVSEALNPGLRLRAGRMGVQDVLEKPLSDGMLLDSIRHAFRSTPA